MAPTIQIVKGDITKQHVEAIVNAANNSLLGGGGVDGAIHQAAGPHLLDECRLLKGCATGEAKITKGYLLPAKWVIHTVGPVWGGGNHHEDDLLARCYRSCFAIVKHYGIRTVAFPCISTGAYGFPMDRAADIALREIKNYVDSHAWEIDAVYVVCFGDDAYRTYVDAFRTISTP